jgi:hypothetical protein
MSKNTGNFKTRSFMLGFSILIVLVLIAAGLTSTAFIEPVDYTDTGSSLAWFSIPFWIGALLTGFGFTSLKLNEAAVVSEFDNPRGYFVQAGMHWNAFWLNLTNVSMADKKHESDVIKINDGNGTPVMTSVAFTARIIEPEKFTYELNQGLDEFIKTSIQGILRNTIKQYPYDACEKEEANTLTLTKSGEEICTLIETAFNKQIEKYGIEVDDLAFSELAYAPEIAVSMLQKQQAQAQVTAKSTLTAGLCEVVEAVVIKLSDSSEFELKDEDKSALVRNLMTVMVSNQEASPVINVDS